MGRLAEHWPHGGGSVGTTRGHTYTNSLLSSPLAALEKRGIWKGHQIWVAGQVGDWARERRPRAVKGLKRGESVRESGRLFVRPAATPGRDTSNSVWWGRRCRRWLGSVTDDQVTKAEDVTAARLSVSDHRSLFTYLIGAALPEEFSAYIFRLFAVPWSVTTWLHYSDQSASNWSSETKSAVLFYSILFTTYVYVEDRFQKSACVVFTLVTEESVCIGGFVQSGNPGWPHWEAVQAACQQVRNIVIIKCTPHCKSLSSVIPPLGSNGTQWDRIEANSSIISWDLTGQKYTSINIFFLVQTNSPHLCLKETSLDLFVIWQCRTQFYISSISKRFKSGTEQWLWAQKKTSEQREKQEVLFQHHLVTDE